MFHFSYSFEEVGARLGSTCGGWCVELGDGWQQGGEGVLIYY